jgi:hypothetical protein
MRRALVLALALCLPFPLAGCGKEDETKAKTSIETQSADATVPVGFTVRLVRDQGFSIALPKEWQSIDAHAALNSKQMQKFRQANPAFATELNALAQQNSPIKLLAVGPDPDRGFVSNLNVLVTPIPSDLSYARWSSAELGELKKVPTIKRLTQAQVQLPAGRALHVTYRATFNRRGGGFTAFIDQYLVKKGTSLYVLTFTTTPRLRGRFERTFSTSVRTLRLSG